MPSAQGRRTRCLRSEVGGGGDQRSDVGGREWWRSEVGRGGWSSDRRAWDVPEHQLELPPPISNRTSLNSSTRRSLPKPSFVLRGRGRDRGRGRARASERAGDVDVGAGGRAARRGEAAATRSEQRAGLGEAGRETPYHSFRRRSSSAFPLGFRPSTRTFLPLAFLFRNIAGRTPVFTSAASHLSSHVALASFRAQSLLWPTPTPTRQSPSKSRLFTLTCRTASHSPLGTCLSVPPTASQQTLLSLSV